LIISVKCALSNSNLRKFENPDWSRLKIGMTRYVSVQPRELIISL
jgi:hypothetical protein